MIRWISILLTLALLAGGAYAFQRFSSRMNAERDARALANLPTEIVTRDDFVVTIEEIGQLAAERSESISPSFRGRLVDLIDDGAAVKAGDPVAWIDIEEEYRTLQNRISNLRTVKAQLEQQAEDIRMSMEMEFLDLQSAAADLEFSQLKLISVNRELMNLEVLREAELAAQKDVDSAQMQLASSKLAVVQSDLSYQGEYETRESKKVTKALELTSLERQRDKHLQRIEERQDNLNNAVVTAPISGIFLIHRNYSWSRRRQESVSVGDTLNSRELIGTIPDLSSLVVQSQINESAITLVTPGARCEITFDAFPGLRIPASIASVGLVAIERERSPAGLLSQNQEFSGQKVFEVTVRPDEIDDRLRPGMTANISIIAKEVENALSVPLKCVFNKGGWRVVYVADDKGGYRAQRVTLGERNRQRVIVLRGLREGDRVFSVDLEPSANNQNGNGGGSTGPALPSMGSGGGSGMGKGHGGH